MIRDFSHTQIILDDAPPKPHATVPDIKPNPNCPIYLYTIQLGSERSVKTAKYALNAFAKYMGKKSFYDIKWEKMDRVELTETIKKLRKSPGREKKAKALSIQTINLYLCVIKGVIKQAFLLDLIDHVEYEKLKSVPGPSGSRIHTPEILTREMAANLFAECDTKGDLGKRDKAMFSLMLGCGLRRDELIKIKHEDIDWETRTLRVIGKGDKERLLRIRENYIDNIKVWAEHTKKSNYLFPCSYRKVYTANQYISADTVYRRCHKYNSLKVNNKTIKPHSFRRTFATWLYENKAPLNAISKLLGHSSTKTTERYLMISNQGLGDAIDNYLY